MKQSQYMIPLSKNIDNKNAMITFPYSGALAQKYRSFIRYLPTHVNLFSIQYPGRGSNISEEPLTSINGMVEVLLEPFNDALKFYNKVYIYGHSLGALIAFVLCQKLTEQGNSLDHVVLGLGACPSPELIGKMNHLHVLPDDIFWEKIQCYGGTPEGIFMDNDLKNLFLPIIKSDFEVYETYASLGSPPVPLDVPIYVYAGRSDPIVPLEAVSGWANYTHSEHRCIIIESDHFFVDEYPKDIVYSMIQQ